MAFISITVKHFFNNGANELQKEKCNKYLLTSSSLFIRTDSKALRFKKASLRYFTCAVYIAFILKQIIDITTLFKQRTHFWPLLSMYEAQNWDSRGSNIYVFTIKKAVQFLSVNIYIISFKCAKICKHFFSSEFSGTKCLQGRLYQPSGINKYMTFTTTSKTVCQSLSCV